MKMTNVPKVVIKTMFTPSYKNLNYKYNSKEKVLNNTMNMFDYYSDNKKRALYMFDYYQGKLTKKDTMNIILENGEYATEEDIIKRKKEYSKYIENSNIYKLVISFPEKYLEKNVDIKKFEKELATKVIPMFFKKCKFVDLNKMSYQFSLHTDTDNLHFHFSFCEKKPNYRCTDNKIKYRNKGKLTEKELNFFKNEILHYINKEKYFTPEVVKLNNEIETLKTFFNKDNKNFLLHDKDDLILENKILELGRLLYRYRGDNNQKIKYGSIKDKEIKNLTNDIRRYIFSNKNPELKNEYDKFKISLENLNEYFNKINIDNNIKSKANNDFIKRKTQYIDNYIFNAIVNHAFSTNRKINQNDIIKEIVYSNYKKNKKQSRYDILNRYFTKTNNIKYINRYRINQAVKNVNKELAEAEKEFAKLFIEEEKQVSLI